MCGIAGFFSLNKISISDFIEVSKSIRHRGPDDEGFFLFNSKEAKTERFGGNDSPIKTLKNINEAKAEYNGGFLHRRLSILDLSENGHQPMTFIEGELTITYNGEIYNYVDLKNELISFGYYFKSNTDTEVLLMGYHKWGKTFVNKLIGMWAFCIYNQKDRSIFISRDRYGIKPLYLYQTNGIFCFCSEIKGLLKFNSINPILNKKVAIEFIAFGKEFDPNNTLFEGIEELPPGYNAVYELDSQQLNLEQYYYPDYNQSNSIDVQEKYDELLHNSIKLHLISDVEVGIMLSGGLDSSAIAAFASPLMNNNKLLSFTTAFDDRDIDESHYSKLVSDHFNNIEAKFIKPTASELINDLDKLILAQDFPIGSTSIFAQWSIMKLVSQNNIKVVLGGQGADEVLGGYFNFAGIYLIELLKQFKLKQFISEYRKLSINMHPNVKKEIVRAIYYYLPQDLQKILRKHERVGPNLINRNYTEVYNQLSIPQQAGKSYKETSIQSIHYGLRRLLRFEDRNSMAYSIESRVPFLDHRLVEFTMSLNNDYKIHNGWTKYILRKSIENKLPKEIVWRKGKKGFLTPQEGWKNELSDYLLDYLQSAKIPDIIDKKQLYNLTKLSQNRPEHITEFWKIFSFIKWIELYNVKF